MALPGKMPDISVILPVYNGMAYLKEAVDSVLTQEYDRFELLVLDDCSGDGSWEYLASLADGRLQLFRNDTNRGLFYNLNYLVRKSKSPLIKLWAQDDIMYPDCLGTFVRFHHAHTNIGFSYCGTDIIDEKGKVRHDEIVDDTPQVISPDLHARIAFYTGSIAGNISNVCLDRNALDHTGLFNEQMKMSADFDMWVRLARNYNTGFIQKKLIKLRDHHGQLSRNENYFLTHVREDLEVYKYLRAYAPPEVLNEGKSVMRNHKLVYYYTLMVKAFLKGRFSTGMGYLRQLASFDNFLLLSFYFFKAKLIRPGKPDFAG